MAPWPAIFYSYKYRQLRILEPAHMPHMRLQIQFGSDFEGYIAGFIPSPSKHTHHLPSSSVVEASSYTWSIMQIFFKRESTTVLGKKWVLEYSLSLWPCLQQRWAGCLALILIDAARCESDKGPEHCSVLCYACTKRMRKDGLVFHGVCASIIIYRK